MTSLTIRCFAKVNLGLSVLSSRPDGYHEIRTILQAVDLADELTVAPAGDLSLEVGGRFAAPAGEANLVMRAARRLAERHPGRGARMSLSKSIPAGAGLGGGSSDAAAALVALDRLWGLGADPGLLYSLARGLGMDVPFFLFGGACLALARGDEVLPLPDGPSWRLVVAWPGVGLSTRQVYAGLSAPLTSARIPSSMSRFAPPAPVRRLHPGAPAGARAEGGEVEVRPPDLDNDLEEIAFRMVPASRRLKERLLAAGAVAAALSGSGSAVFGLFPEDAENLGDVVTSLETGGAAAFGCRTLTREEYRLNQFQTSRT